MIGFATTQVSKSRPLFKGEAQGLESCAATHHKVFASMAVHRWMGEYLVSDLARLPLRMLHLRQVLTLELTEAAHVFKQTIRDFSASEWMEKRWMSEWDLWMIRRGSLMLHWLRGRRNERKNSQQQRRNDEMRWDVEIKLTDRQTGGAS